MGELRHALAKDELQEGKMRALTVAGRDILLARVGDSYYATDDRCPHRGARLSEGSLAGTVVTCPGHGSQFDLRDGRAVRWLQGSGASSTLVGLFKPAKPLHTYDTKTENNGVFIDL